MNIRIADRRASVLVAGALLFAPLAACSSTTEPAETDATATEATETSAAEEPEASESPEATGEGTDTGTESDVDCSGTSCSVTLTGDGAEADILGTSVVLGGVENGEATFRIGNEEVTCGEGDTTEAGPLTLECSSVGDGTVTMTASLG